MLDFWRTSAAFQALQLYQYVLYKLQPGSRTGEDRFLFHRVCAKNQERFPELNEAQSVDKMKRDDVSHGKMMYPCSCMAGHEDYVHIDLVAWWSQ